MVDSTRLDDDSSDARWFQEASLSQSSQKRWPAVVAVAVMLLAMFGYLASLDESEPAALPDAMENSGDYGD